MSRFYDRASNLVRRIYERRIDAPAILDADADFPNAARFVAAWQAIRDEALALRVEKVPRFHELMPEQADISANDGLDWRMFILKAYDVEVPENIARLPTLKRLLAECPRKRSEKAEAHNQRAGTLQYLPAGDGFRIHVRLLILSPVRFQRLA